MLTIKSNIQQTFPENFRDFELRKPSKNQIVSSHSLYAQDGEQC